MTQPIFNLDGASLNYGPNGSMEFTRSDGQKLIVNPDEMDNPRDQLACVNLGIQFTKKKVQKMEQLQTQNREDFKEMHAQVNRMWEQLGMSTLSSHSSNQKENETSLVTKAKNSIYCIYTSIKDFFFVSSNT